MNFRMNFYSNKLIKTLKLNLELEEKVNIKMIC